MPSASTPCVPDTADLIFHDQVCEMCSPPTNVSMKSKPRAFNCGRSLADCCVGGAACRCCGCCCCCCHCCCCCSSCCCIACMNWSSVNAISMLRVIQLCYHVRGLFSWSQRQSSLVMITVGRRCTKLTKRCEVCMWKRTVHNVSVGGRVVLTLGLGPFGARSIDIDTLKTCLTGDTSQANRLAFDTPHLAFGVEKEMNSFLPHRETRSRWFAWKKTECVWCVRTPF